MTESLSHRVLPGFVAQGGDPTGTGLAGPGYAFANEISPDVKFDQAGLFAMGQQRTGTPTESQFFITFSELPDLDGSYTIFGRVVSGMDVAENLTARKPGPKS